MSDYEFPFVQWQVKTSAYHLRPINSAFPRGSEELKSLVLNFRLHPLLTIPMSKGYFAGTATSYIKANRALDSLVSGSWIEMALNYSTDNKRPRVYRRSAKFEQFFKMRVGKKLRLKEEALSKRTQKGSAKDGNRGTPLSDIPELKTYSALVDGVKLSMSDGTDVFRDIDLHKKEGGRIYAHGAYEYQNMSKRERLKLLIGGEETAEADYKSMHANMLLNRAGEECRPDLYEKILSKLGLKVTNDRRDAIKTLTNASFNLKTPGGFAPMARLRKDKKGVHIMDYLGVKPTKVRDAITIAHPELSPYVCSGGHSEWLQRKESEVLISVLETLAEKSILALPLHDSVIVPRKFLNIAEQVMKEVYIEWLGFDIIVE